MKKLVSLFLAVIIVASCTVFAFASENAGYIVITDYVQANDGTDVADEIQAVIDSNPNRTIYFSDGEYLISKPIVTPADPRKSVDLQLSNYAVIKAVQGFEGNALIMLGGKDSANDTHTNGSNYSLTGGIIDGSGFANGVEISGGRETAVRNVSIKNTPVGLHIAKGVNSGSSDADISNVNIIGTGGTDSVGIFVEGCDNTISNVRIGNVFIGVHLKSSANSLRDVHPLYYSDYADYENSCGFLDEVGSNVYDFCYSDQFCIGFRTTGNVSSVYTNCYCYWYTSQGGRQIGFKADRFNSVVENFRPEFRDDTENSVLVSNGIGGKGCFDNLIVNSDRVSDNLYRFYCKGTFLWFIKSIFGWMF